MNPSRYSSANTSDMSGTGPARRLPVHGAPFLFSHYSCCRQGQPAGARWWAPRAQRRVNIGPVPPDRPPMSANPKARILAEALPYIRAYHGKTLVIRFGGNAMADPALKAGFARDVALLRSVGMKPIVVHGGGWRIDALMRQMGMESRRHRGLRVTDERTLTVVEMALDELNQELTGLINTHGGRAVGLNGQDGRFIHARRLTMSGDDGRGKAGAPELGFVGDVESI